MRTAWVVDPRHPSAERGPPRTLEVANRMPAAASYLKAVGDDMYRAFKFDVLRIVDGRIAEITTLGPELFPQFGLPETLAD